MVAGPDPPIVTGTAAPTATVTTIALVGVPAFCCLRGDGPGPDLRGGLFGRQLFVKVFRGVNGDLALIGVSYTHQRGLVNFITLTNG